VDITPECARKGGYFCLADLVSDGVGNGREFILGVASLVAEEG